MKNYRLLWLRQYGMRIGYFITVVRDNIGNHYPEMLLVIGTSGQQVALLSIEEVADGTEIKEGWVNEK